MNLFNLLIIIYIKIMHSSWVAPDMSMHALQELIMKTINVQITFILIECFRD